MVQGDEGRLDGRLAYVLLRTTFGIDFLGHGFSRLFHGDQAFAHGMVTQLAGTPLPDGFIYTFGLVLPFFEFAIGTLLILGVFTRPALIVGSVIMMSLMVGTTLHQDWAGAGTQLIYSLIFAVLLAFRFGWDTSWPALLRRG